MQPDNLILNIVAPTNPTDRFVVRHLDGGLPQLERLLNLLPSPGWRLRYFTMASLERPVVVFERELEESDAESGSAREKKDQEPAVAR